jgi:hypothetical protein
MTVERCAYNLTMLIHLWLRAWEKVVGWFDPIYDQGWHSVFWDHHKDRIRVNAGSCVYESQYMVIGSENDSSWTETASGWTWELTMHSGHEASLSLSTSGMDQNGYDWPHTLIGEGPCRGGNRVNRLSHKSYIRMRARSFVKQIVPVHTDLVAKKPHRTGDLEWVAGCGCSYTLWTNSGGLQ